MMELKISFYGTKSFIKAVNFNENSKKDTAAKTINLEVVGTTDTLLLSWFISGDLSTGVSIGLAELFSKMFILFA